MLDTKSNILDLAEKLIRTKGYNAFSYKDISDPLQIKNAAVHYHYPSKKNLGIAVIEKNRMAFQKLTGGGLQKKSAKNQVRVFLEIYKKSQNAKMICFMGALGSSYESLPEEMQNHLSNASKEIRDWLTQVLNKGKVENELNFKETAQEKADLIMSSLLASLILNRVTGENITKTVVTAITEEL